MKLNDSQLKSSCDLLQPSPSPLRDVGSRDHLEGNIGGLA